MGSEAHRHTRTPTDVAHTGIHTDWCTHTQIDMHAGTRAQAGRHTGPLRNIQTGSRTHGQGHTRVCTRAHTHTQVGRQTDPHTNRLRHTYTDTHGCVCVFTSAFQSTDTHCRNAQTPHTHERGALNLHSQLVSWHWETEGPCPGIGSTSHNHLAL